jgi:hypothetical protein
MGALLAAEPEKFQVGGHEADTHAERRWGAPETRSPRTASASSLSPWLQRPRSSDGKPAAERRAARGAQGRPRSAGPAAARAPQPARQQLSQPQPADTVSDELPAGQEPRCPQPGRHVRAPGFLGLCREFCGSCYTGCRRTHAGHAAPARDMPSHPNRNPAMVTQCTHHKIRARAISCGRRQALRGSWREAGRG